jgi:single-strand DNA-binding protein
MNNFSGIGRLVKDNNFVVTPNGTEVLKNTIAINRRFKRDESDFINILAFKKTAELINNHFEKGDEIAISGSVQTGSYEKDGRKIYTTEILVDNVTFTNGKKNKGQSSNNQQSQNNNQSNHEPYMPDESELPF